MDRYILTRPVTVTGPSFWSIFGKETWVRLEPADKPGWWLRKGGVDVLIQPHHLERHTRRSRLMETIEVWEHLGALRFMGLDEVRVVSEGPWLPHDGSPWIYWVACKPALKRVGELTKRTLPERLIAQTCDEKKNPSVKYIPYPTDRLEVVVRIDYPGLGSMERTYTLPGADLEELFKVKTQGWWPLGVRQVAWLASVFLRWPHYKNTTWPTSRPAEETLERFCDHRFVDILGDFSVLCEPGSTLVGGVFSSAAGHREDVEIARQAGDLKQTPASMAAE